MARKIEVTMVDDLDGKSRADETHRFSFGGYDYEIDLSEKHAKEFAERMSEFVDAARRTGRSTTRTAVHAPASRNGASTPAAAPARPDKEQNAAIRAWAKKMGKQVSERGRIPQHIVEEYDERGGLASPPKVDPASRAAITGHGMTTAAPVEPQEPKPLTATARGTAVAATRGVRRSTKVPPVKHTGRARRIRGE